jgi:hypothetical protein
MMSLGFNGLTGQRPQPQQLTPAMAGTYAGMTPPQAQDPQSVYLAQALQSMSQQPQGNVGGLSANLLATALDQYALQQRQQQLMQAGAAQGNGGNPPPSLPLQGSGGGTMLDATGAPIPGSP